jgi:hypothetical protein
VRGLEHAKLVALGIGHHGPRQPFFLDKLKLPRAQPHQPFHLGPHLVGSQVEMQPVLTRFGFGDTLKQQPGTNGSVRLPSRRSDKCLPTTQLDLETQRLAPEAAQGLRIGAVEGQVALS